MRVVHVGSGVHLLSEVVLGGGTSGVFVVDGVGVVVVDGVSVVVGEGEVVEVDVLDDVDEPEVDEDELDLLLVESVGSSWTDFSSMGGGSEGEAATRNPRPTRIGTASRAARSIQSRPGRRRMGASFGGVVGIGHGPVDCPIGCRGAFEVTEPA